MVRDPGEVAKSKAISLREQVGLRTGCESPQKEKKKPSWPLENEVQITSTNKSQMKEGLLDSGRLEGKEGTMRLLLA